MNSSASLLRHFALLPLVLLATDAAASSRVLHRNSAEVRVEKQNGGEVLVLKSVEYFQFTRWEGGVPVSLVLEAARTTKGIPAEKPPTTLELRTYRSGDLVEGGKSPLASWSVDAELAELPPERPGLVRTTNKACCASSTTHSYFDAWTGRLLFHEDASQGPFVIEVPNAAPALGGERLIGVLTAATGQVSARKDITSRTILILTYASRERALQRIRLEGPGPNGISHPYDAKLELRNNRAIGASRNRFHPRWAAFWDAEKKTTATEAYDGVTLTLEINEPDELELKVEIPIERDRLKPSKAKLPKGFVMKEL